MLALFGMSKRRGISFRRSSIWRFVLHMVSQKRWRAKPVQCLQSCDTNMAKASEFTLSYCSACGCHGYRQTHLEVQDICCCRFVTGDIIEPHGNAGTIITINTPHHILPNNKTSLHHTTNTLRSTHIVCSHPEQCLHCYASEVRVDHSC